MFINTVKSHNLHVLKILIIFKGFWSKSPKTCNFWIKTRALLCFIVKNMIFHIFEHFLDPAWKFHGFSKNWFFVKIKNFYIFSPVQKLQNVKNLKIPVRGLLYSVMDPQKGPFFRFGKKCKIGEIWILLKIHVFARPVLLRYSKITHFV